MQQIGINRLTQLDSFRSALGHYINGGCLSRADILASVLGRSAVFQRNSKWICQKHKDLYPVTRDENSAPFPVQVRAYEGKNPYVLRMVGYLNKYLRNDLFGAYVHGSLGTCEEIRYSDFDALVILKDEVFESPKRLARVARKLSDALLIMYEFDPLQHHGWFVLAEGDLGNYPEHYFPIEALKHAKSLFPGSALELVLRLNDSEENGRETFEKVSSAIIERIDNADYPNNMYQLKSLLSQFMLLPALYVRTKNGRGIFKKESFALARNDLKTSDWAVMNKISSIRDNWDYEIRGAIKWLPARNNMARQYFARKLAPRIPQRIAEILTPQFYSQMANFVLAMRKSLNKSISK